MVDQSTEEQDFTPERQLKKVHDVIEHPDQFADVFCAALSTQVNMRSKVKEIVLEIIKTDVAGRSEIKKLVQEVNNEDWRTFVKSAWGKFAVASWTFIVVIVTVLIQKWLV